VGWTGCGPIELLIENILGFRPNGAENSLVWQSTRIERHGIENLRFGDIVISLICNKRESVFSPMDLIISNNKNLKLVIRNLLGNEKILELDPGQHRMKIEF